jgi:phosphoglycerate dehydrogenase-like enzyme
MQDTGFKMQDENPELVMLPNVIANPHIAASTTEAQGKKVGYDIV